MTAITTSGLRTDPSVALAPLGLPRDGFETVGCYLCGSQSTTPFLSAEDDLTGKPGRFTFVTCTDCGLRYQNPRLTVDHIKAYYDDEYIAHRKKSDWGVLTGFFNWAMSRHDRQKDKLVSEFVKLDAKSEVLDVGCAVGTFLQTVRSRYGAPVTGVDFKDLSAHPALAGVDFRCGLFYEQDFGSKRFDLITMWHFLEHDYDPIRTLCVAGDLLAPRGRLIIEVPRLDSTTFRMYGDRWPGLQAPQHTVLYDRKTFLAAMDAAGLEVVAYLPYGAFPAFFYFFAGAAFKLLRGKGLNLSRAIYPYFIGQLLFAPILAFEKQLNFAMQTVVCRRRHA
jgi:SAM-dependent methyltransferase